MEQQNVRRALHGAIGGVVAGMVVVVWFFVMDLAAGQPFDTPARLSSAVLRADFTGPWPSLIFLYTELHFAVFVVLGILTAFSLRWLHLEPGLMLGAVFGVGVLNAVHYMGMLVTGTNLLTVVPIGHVAAANLLGGMLMMSYLHRALQAESPFGWSLLKRYPLVYEGLVTGLVGAVAVAVWFLVVDLKAGAPLYTPAALGSALLLGAAGAAEVQLNVTVIAAYSILHVATFAVVGIAFAWLAQQVENLPDFGLRALAVLLLLEGLFVGTVGMTSGWIVQELGWVTILVANALAVAGMTAWTWHSRPQLREAVASRQMVAAG